MRKQGLTNLPTSLMGVGDFRKATPGITELSRARVPIDPAACYFDVGSTHPGSAAGAKGKGVHRLKGLVSLV